MEREKKGTAQSLLSRVVQGKLMARPAVMDKIGSSRPRLSPPRIEQPRHHPKARLSRNLNRKEEARFTGFSIKIKVRKLLNFTVNNETEILFACFESVERRPVVYPITQSYDGNAYALRTSVLLG